MERTLNIEASVLKCYAQKIIQMHQQHVNEIEHIQNFYTIRGGIFSPIHPTKTPFLPRWTFEWKA